MCFKESHQLFPNCSFVGTSGEQNIQFSPNNKIRILKATNQATKKEPKQQTNQPKTKQQAKQLKQTKQQQQKKKKTTNQVKQNKTKQTFDKEKSSL